MIKMVYRDKRKSFKIDTVRQIFKNMSNDDDKVMFQLNAYINNLERRHKSEDSPMMRKCLKDVIFGIKSIKRSIK